MALDVANRDSTSSVTTPNYSESGSGYSTPLTSNVPTPAPEKSSTRTSKFEVVIPGSSKTRGSTMTAMQKAKDYMPGNDSKRKRGFVEIADSEDDEDDEWADPSPMARRTRNDEKVARQLQEELDHEATLAFLASDDDQDASEDDMSDSDFSVTDPKGKGKGKAVASRSRSTQPTTSDFIKDSEEDDEDYVSDPVAYEPPTKKQKTKGKANMPAPPLSDDDEDEPGTSATDCILPTPNICPFTPCPTLDQFTLFVVMIHAGHNYLLASLPEIKPIFLARH